MSSDTRAPSAPIDPEETINMIVARRPQALGVLRGFGLDTCCGGALPLRVAAQHHGIDLAALLAALGAAGAGAQR